ncbi:MAG TPA: hypothetical protein VMR73_00390, partial [Candidatus Paceibacterota bacterium]|nr:hypothetical protein [Candidatus Paceibacterota bacterium]
MNKNILVSILSLAVIVLLALLVAPYLVTHNQSVENMQMASMPGMVMKTFDIASSTPTPTIGFMLTKDTLDGYDLHITTTNFTFTPQNINQAPVADQGHVHLYIDTTLTVLLGPWYHIPSTMLPPGKHTITVSLNANDHSLFTFQGKPIQATQTLYT